MLDLRKGLPRGAAPPRPVARPALRQQPNARSQPHFVDGLVAEVFASRASTAMVDRLTEAPTAFGNVNSMHDLIEHSQLCTRAMPVHGRSVEIYSHSIVAGGLLLTS